MNLHLIQKTTHYENTVKAGNQSSYLLWRQVHILRLKVFCVCLRHCAVWGTFWRLPIFQADVLISLWILELEAPLVSLIVDVWQSDTSRGPVMEACSVQTHW